jgi:histidinol-phosphate aminotransferase
MVSDRIHGGPDARGPARHDFSTNANAAGPCPQALEAVRGADATRYPDPRYTALKERLAQRHAVAPARVHIAASASEFIQRFTAWAAGAGARTVNVPRPGYADYAQAARARSLECVAGPADLVWRADPQSPSGRNADAVCEGGLATVLDLAYAPLRLEGEGASSPGAWQLWTPNKALGLTGVRAAYAIAPGRSAAVLDGLEALAPSWPVGAHGVAMLEAWCDPHANDWLAASLATLRTWKRRQQERLAALGWTLEPSDANFFLATPPSPVDAEALRRQGIQLRDATSFGLPGRFRLSVQPPASQDALCRALGAPA